MKELIQQNNRRSLEPTGIIVPELMRNGSIGFDSSLPLILGKAQDRMQELTSNNFLYGTGIVVPEVIQLEENTIQPMIYVNENNYKIPTTNFNSVPELITFDDMGIFDWLIQNGQLNDMTDEDTVWIFPGGGGMYMQQEFSKREIRPVNSINIAAKRQLGNIGMECKVQLPDFSSDQIVAMNQASKIVFADDAICTGSTIGASIRALEQWIQPEDLYTNLYIVTQTLATPRKNEDLIRLLKDIPAPTALISAILYGGQAQRPRLLSTGSIVRGLEDPTRFSQKKYPEELIEKVMKAVISG